MSQPSPENPPAFPVVGMETLDLVEVDGDFIATTVKTDRTGMSLRDWFAGQALAGLWADHTLDAGNDETATRCYLMADAMLAERAKS